MEVSYKTTLVG